MIKYVAGFLFNNDKTKVALIRKIKPEWQKGMLNGVGGKVEEDESEIDAMCREFKEETGMKTYYYDWKPLIKIKSQKNDWIVNVFYCNGDIDLNQLKTTTDEKIEIVNVNNLENENVIPNLRWLIRMCFDKDVISGEIIQVSKI